VAGLPEDERFATNRQRVITYDELRPLVADRLRTEPRRTWIEKLTAAGIPCGSVRNLQELFDDPQIAAREMIAQAEHSALGTLRLLGVPVKLSDTPGTIRSAPPLLGEHTERVLRDDVGLDAAAIARLRERRVI